ncbi:MAG: hypothetical protein JO062_17795 [Bryobacterales bacterium]|nr:hypothetical protein [Acidobacteriota bacterium]MBV9399838.1 hypothetical protein [Bryobacterales bacterium]
MNDFVKSFIWPMFANLVPLCLIAAFGWFQFRKQHLHTLKMGLFSELMGNRYNITGDAFSAALNRALVLFHDDPDVVRAVRDFAYASTNKNANNKDLLVVFRSICRNLRIPDETITNADFETAFNVRDNAPIPVILAVAHAPDAPQPQVLIFGRRAPNTLPFTVAVLDASAVEQLQQQLQQQWAQAQIAASKRSSAFCGLDRYIGRGGDIGRVVPINDDLASFSLSVGATPQMTGY